MSADSAATTKTTTTADTELTTTPPHRETKGSSIRQHSSSKISSAHHRSIIIITWLGCVAIFACSIWIYAGPIWQARNHHELIVDERHLFDGSNADVEGTSKISTLWKNDYWGRSIHRHDSHKSWRPLTVLSFRFAKRPTKILGIIPLPKMSAITWHRLINVLLHAIIAQLVGLVASRLFIGTRSRSISPSSLPFSITAAADAAAAGTQHWLSILVFAWHPTHVEVVANAANRPHLLAIGATCFVILMATNPTMNATTTTNKRSVFHLDVSRVWSGIVLVLGLLCSETMVFQLVPIMATATLIRWKQLKQRQHFQSNKSISRDSAADQQERHNQTLWQLLVQDMFPLWLFWSSLVLLYLGLRFWANTLSVPTDLIDRAEVPFHALRGWTRFYSFAYVVAIHVGKAVGLDWIGFAHEYSYNCIPPIESVGDARILTPLFIMLGIILMTAFLFSRRSNRKPIATGSQPDDPMSGPLDDNDVDKHVSNDDDDDDDDEDDTFWLWIVALSWFTSLLPISGLVKVGTFVADRIVVPSTVGASIVMTRFFLTTLWTKPSPLPLRMALLAMTCWWWWGLGSARILQRTKEWTRNDLLFLSAQQTCPTSAKNLLQLSKLYSAPASDTHHSSIRQDLDKALALVQQSHAIDPEFCRVHYQFAHVYLQQPNYKKMERHLAKALACPHTGANAMDLWNKYWSAMANQDPGALSRRDRYVQELMAGNNQRKEKKKKKKKKKRGLDLNSKNNEL